MLAELQQQVYLVSRPWDFWGGALHGTRAHDAGTTFRPFDSMDDLQETDNEQSTPDKGDVNRLLQRCSSRDCAQSSERHNTPLPSVYRSRIYWR